MKELKRLFLMKKAIVTTTINTPTVALRKYATIAQEQEWRLYIVGDLKTPHEEYQNLSTEFENTVYYLSPEWQSENYPELSKVIGWNCIQRRNFGFIAAYKYGAEIIATVDDDNIPLEGNWGMGVNVNQITSATLYETFLPVFDPLAATNNDTLWHRGFPVQLLDKKNMINDAGWKRRKVLIQADLWNGDPDVDAICRMAFRPEVVFKNTRFFTNKMAPFNSQNTFLSRTVFPTYFLFPGIGRMDDIWAAYITQHYFPDSVLFGRATVYQKRNPHNLVKDLENEMIGYKNTLKLIENIDSYENFLPEQALVAYELYKKEFFNE